MAFESNELVVRRCGPDTWQLEESLVYHGKHDTITVPAGFETDFASVPRVFTWMVPKYGKYTLASVLHDYLCEQLHEGRARWIPASDEKLVILTSRDVDGLFRRVMREQDVPVLQRWIMWAGVRVGAMFNKNRRPGILQDVPLMLCLLLVTLPFTLVPAVGILLALAVYLPLEKLLGL